jgi:mRNA-degrading endonuclease RelE of RelBE toxin-antitoxin system
MKTTVDIPDSVLEDAKHLAARQRTTVRALIIEGLRRLISERKRPTSYRLRKATFKGRGLQPDVAEGSWERIRDFTYEGRGS